MIIERQFAAGVEREHLNGGIAECVSGEGHDAAIGRGRWKSGDRIVVRELALASAIPVHDPDLFGAGAVGDENDSGAYQAFCAELGEDIGGVAVRGVDRALPDRAKRCRSC